VSDGAQTSLGSILKSTLQHEMVAHVGFGSKADVARLNVDVCFTPKSDIGRGGGHVR
jgi:hypothetical protein